MSATNTTPNYGLPQFTATDKPTWQGDFNGAMSKIDTAIKENAGGGGVEVVKTLGAGDITGGTVIYPYASIIKVDGHFYLIGWIRFSSASSQSQLKITLGEGYKTQNFGYAIVSSLTPQLVATDLTNGVLTVNVPVNSSDIYFPMVCIG